MRFKIVSVGWNCAVYLEQTLRSVEEQEWQDWDSMIVDAQKFGFLHRRACARGPLPAGEAWRPRPIVRSYKLCKSAKSVDGFVFK